LQGCMPIFGFTTAKPLRSFSRRGHYDLCEKCGLTASPGAGREHLPGQSAHRVVRGFVNHQTRLESLAARLPQRVGIGLSLGQVIPVYENARGFRDVVLVRAIACRQRRLLIGHFVPP
jgi:hypothetical protein